MSNEEDFDIDSVSMGNPRAMSGEQGSEGTEKSVNGTA
jgi:hypothetical protein